ncbi:hypothetical protein RB195_024034 [Necator americanus]|uniref:Pao retrotransposon peptidase n=1 Tax=Necator americanus TaxID=51031 RepID=A0ABR1ELS6_NECAM
MHKEFVSKRTVAQQIASVYDPLGWYTPLLVKAKYFQQQLWKHQYDWDEPLNQEDTQQWHKLITSINGFQHKIPRMIAESNKTYTLITYTDASSIAMAACTYLSTDTKSHILMAKSKVSDAKREITILKLELNAITIGTRLSFNVIQSLTNEIHIHRILILSDSEIALKWIASPNTRSSGVFVANRIKEVQKVVRDLNSLKILVQFGYIDTNHNPADCGTRGLTKDQFSAHIWWTGYTLKQITENKIARDFVSIPDNEGEELPSSIEMHIRVTENDNSDQVTDILELATFSFYSKAKRILAFALRFLKNTTSRLRGELQSKLHRHLSWLLSNEQGNHLSAKDILDAQHVLIKNHQMVHINRHYKQELSKNLNLKQDKAGLLRAYGRLNKSDLNTLAKNPIIIVPNTDLSRLIIDDAHGIYHKGIPHTMSDV